MVDPEDAGPQPEDTDPWISGSPGLPDSYGAVLSNVGLDDPTKMVLSQQCGQQGQSLVTVGGAVTWTTTAPTVPSWHGPTVDDSGVCVIRARDVAVQTPEEGSEPISLVDELEELNLRMDRIDEKHEMVLDRLDELLGLLKDLKKG